MLGYLYKQDVYERMTCKYTLGKLDCTCKVQPLSILLIIVSTCVVTHLHALA